MGVFQNQYRNLMDTAKFELMRFIKNDGFIHEQISSTIKVIHYGIHGQDYFITEYLDLYDDSFIKLDNPSDEDLILMADACENMTANFMIKTTVTTSLRHTHENYKFFKNIYEVNESLKYDDCYCDNDAIFIGELVNGKWEQIDCEVRLIRNDKTESFGASIDAVLYYDLSGFEAINEFLNYDSGFVHVVLTKREN